jgi:hypothetical protein
MPLPIGQWNAVVNGDQMQLVIDGVNVSTGELQGNIGGSLLRGFWDEVAQALSFAAITGPIPAVNVNIAQDVTGKFRQFSGYLMQTPTSPQPGMDLTWTLAGTYAAGPEVGGTSRRTCYGWYATIRQIV